jgi:hypothetical protein
LDLASVANGVDFEREGYALDSNATAPAGPEWEMPEVSAPWMSRSKPTEEWEAQPEERKRALAAIWAEDVSDTELAASLLLANSSEDEQLRTSEQFVAALRALQAEEEEEEEGAEDKGEGLAIKFVSKPVNATDTESRGKKRAGEKKVKEDAQLDDGEIEGIIDDDRFADLFGRPGYGVDTADPKFKRTPAMEKFMAEVGRKRKRVAVVERPNSVRPPHSGMQHSRSSHK